ncbi:MAG: DUF748 domain-containing protein [Campylobacterota bacterium]|nr:DUF748 domain-containing protein [Campylobacterota bacterium]
MKKIILYTFLAYTVLGFVIIPFILKSQLVDIVEQETHAKISVDSVYFNPYLFKLKLYGIELKDRANIDIIALKSVSLDVELYSLFRSAIHVKNLKLEKPELSVVYEKDKTINLASIAKKSDKEKKIASQDDSQTMMPRVIIDNISIVDGFLEYEDYSHETKFDFVFDDIRFELKDIDTADFKSSDATLRFYTTLGDGGFFDFKSEIVGFDPFIVKGSVSFEASKLYSQYRYVQDILNIEIADGKIDFDAQYYFNAGDIDATTIDKMSLSVKKLRIKPKHKHKDILNLDSLLFSNISVKPMLQRVHVGGVSLSSLALKVKRDSDLEIDWLEYIKVDAPQKESSEETEESSPWSVKVDDISLEKIAVNFDDSGISPKVDSRLNEMNIYMQNLTLKGEEALSYQMNFKLNDEFICDSKGDIKHQYLGVHSFTTCSGLDIVKFNPYIEKLAKDALRVYDLKLYTATLGFDFNLSTTKLGEELHLSVDDANLNIDDFAINKNSTQERLLGFKEFKIDNLSLDTVAKTINIKKTTLDGLDIKTVAQKDGKLNLDNLVVSKTTKTTKKKTQDKKTDDYRVHLKHFALQSAKLSFDDKTLNPRVETKLDKINLDAYNIDSKEKSWLDYQFAMRINSKGYLRSKGKIGHSPTRQKGSFDLEKISLVEFSPYIEKNLHVKIDDGSIDLKTETKYQKNKKDADLKVNGRLDVNEFFLFDSRDDSTLLSFNNLALKSFDYEMFPERAFVNELDVDGFYVNAIVDEDKMLNFASLSKVEKEVKSTKIDDENATKFPFKIMKLNISSGSANFSDFSLPLHFKTDIHDLNGVVYSISSENDEISYVDIVGEVDEYGSTKLIGSIESSNPKTYTNLDFNFRNLELSSVSGYSADFAGYKIDDGKLFLDLGYEIVDSNLLGKNSMIIKNIKLGDEIEDENSSSLPLDFAIALLEDSDGIIDINMPVEGNVDEPDFKYGALVWKTFGNLIVKAVASPFKFLGAMMGIDGDDLGFIDFEPGVATILPPEREKLDNITKLMIKRPRISLKITPQYDELQDTQILKKQKLIALVMQKSGSKNTKEQKNAMNIDLLEEIYRGLAPDKDPELIEENLQKRYQGKALEREYLKALVRESTNMQKVSLDELKTLAKKRVELLVEYLIQSKGLQSSRVIINEPKNTQELKDGWVQTILEIVI